MGDLRRWLQQQPARIVPLFATDDNLVVQTHLLGSKDRRLLRRHPTMEEAVVTEVANGLDRPDWTGLLYMMGWGSDLRAFTPLYIGKAARQGVKHPVSANLKNLERDKSKFARWGDGNAYHIGDLSHVLFKWSAYKEPSDKYERWVEMLFIDRALPRLREQAFLILVPWSTSSTTPSGATATIEQAEEELILLAIAEYESLVLNVVGETWWSEKASAARPPDACRPRRPVRWVGTREEFVSTCAELAQQEVIGLDVETDIWTRRLCLIQVATKAFTAIIDPLAVGSLDVLAAALGSAKPIKVIHNAPFERRVLAEVGIAVFPVFDTLVRSREHRGPRVLGGHGLAAVCKRELGLVMSKALQTSPWMRRPLTSAQIEYAALDAEVLIDLYQIMSTSSPQLQL